MISLSPQVVHEMCMDGWDTPPPRATATPPRGSEGAENAPSSPPTATGDQQELAFVALRAQLREANQEKTRAVAFARDAAVAAELEAKDKDEHQIETDRVVEEEGEGQGAEEGGVATATANLKVDTDLDQGQQEDHDRDHGKDQVATEMSFIK